MFNNLFSKVVPFMR